VLIEASLDFEGDPDVVWGRISDVERIPEYWRGTKSLRVHEREEGVKKVVAAARFAFGGSGRVEITADAESKTLLQRYLSGPFTGTQVVRIAGKKLEARWDIEFHGLFKIGSGRTAGHFKSGTVHALERLSAGGEQKQTQQQQQAHG
jgi:hypothetical protein